MNYRDKESSLSSSSESSALDALELYDDAKRDPKLKAALNDAREIQQAFASGNISTEETIELLRQLDKELWGDFMRQTMSVTGHVQLYESVAPRQNGYLYDLGTSADADTPSVYVENIDMRSAGFILERDITGKSTVKLFGIRASTNEKGDTKQTGLSVPLDVDITFPGVSSQEQLDAVRQVFIPNLIAEIDERILNGEDSVEASLLALRGVSLDELDTIPEEDQQLAARALYNYLNTLMPLDKEAPYIVGYAGSAHHLDRNTMITTEVFDALVAVQHITLRQTKSDEEKKWWIALDGKVLTAPGGVDPSISFLLDNVTNLKSLRAAYYENSPVAP